jgi:anti-sigma-K factor RskA
VSSGDPRPPRDGDDVSREQLAAYAVDAVDPDERQAVDAAVAADTALAAELRAWLEVAGELGAAVAEDPPPGLRQAVLAAAAATPQEAPGAAPAPRRTARPVPDEPTSTPRPPAPRRRARVRAGLALAAAVAAVAAVGAGTVAWRAGQQNDRLAAEQAAITEVLTAPDATTASGDAAGGGRGTVITSAEQGQSVFVAQDLPARPDSQTYQLWLIGPDGAASAGLVDPAGGDVTRVLDTPAGDVTTVGLSVEPAGGSPQPTDPVLLVPIA